MNNRYIKALAGLVLLSASIHILILVIYSVIEWDIRYLNYFDILDIDLIFPGIVDGPASQILSVVTIVIIFFVVYAGLSREMKLLRKVSIASFWRFHIPRRGLPKKNVQH